MIPLADMHCHLLAGLDDGPRTQEDAVEMCRQAYADGTRIAAAGAHQNEQWHAVTPQSIRQAHQRLVDRLRLENIPLSVFPCAEVMVEPDIVDRWQRGEFLSVADKGRYLLVEMPHGLFLDLRDIMHRLGQLGVGIVLAHPERHPEFLHEDGPIEEMIAGGCLVQVSAASITHPASRADQQAVKSWFKRGIVHLLGSDGHSPRRRAPKMGDAYRQIVRWIGNERADRICSTNGLAVSQGLALRVAAPEPRKVGWLPRLW